MNAKMVTVIIPAHKAARWLPTAIESVMRQPIEKEILVVEDGIADNTQSVIENYPDVELIQLEENQGPSTARNTGLQNAKTPFVHFLDADDFLEGDWLADCVSQLASSGADLCYGPYTVDGPGWQRRPVISPSTKSLNHLVSGILRGDAWAQIWVGRVVWRRDSIEKIGGWRQEMSINEDLEIVLRALLQGCRITASRRGLSVYWQHDSPERNSRPKGRNMDDSQNIVLSLIEKGLEDGLIDGDEVKEGIAHYCYRLARCSFRDRNFSSGNVWLARAHEYGTQRHYGTWRHKLGASVFGLKNKELISVRGHRLISRMRSGKYTKRRV